MKGGFGPLFVLVPHAPSLAVNAVQASLERRGSGLGVRYVLEGKLEELRLSPPRGAELWQHTCFEIFIAAQGMQGYCEFNFSPGGDWAAYSFARYREGVRLHDQALDPQVASHTQGNRLELEALVPLGHLSISGDLSVGLSAVVETREGELAYWALRHPPGPPDFHHPDCFAARIDAARN
jgi:hypothetical protein